MIFKFFLASLFLTWRYSHSKAGLSLNHVDTRPKPHFHARFDPLFLTCAQCECIGNELLWADACK